MCDTTYVSNRKYISQRRIPRLRRLLPCHGRGVVRPHRTVRRKHGRPPHQLSHVRGAVIMKGLPEIRPAALHIPDVQEEDLFTEFLQQLVHILPHQLEAGLTKGNPVAGTVRDCHGFPIAVPAGEDAGVAKQTPYRRVIRMKSHFHPCLFRRRHYRPDKTLIIAP